MVVVPASAPPRVASPGAGALLVSPCRLRPAAVAGLSVLGLVLVPPRTLRAPMPGRLRSLLATILFRVSRALNLMTELCLTVCLLLDDLDQVAGLDGQLVLPLAGEIIQDLGHDLRPGRGRSRRRRRRYTSCGSS